MFPLILILTLITVFAQQQRPSRAAVVAQQNCEAEKRRLQTQIDQLNRRIAALQQELGNTREKLGSTEREIERLKAENARLNNLASDLRGAQQNINTLQQQLRQVRQELQGSQSENARLAALNLTLNHQVTQLQEQSNRLKAELDIAQAALQAASANSPVTNIKGTTLEQLRANPQAVLNLAESYGEESAESVEIVIPASEPGEKTRVIRELVIGTLEVEYENEVEAGKDYRIKATFTPHPIMEAPASADEEKITWYLELEYNSTNITKVAYDAELSGRKAAKREVSLNGRTETWGWKITPPPGFGEDAADIIVYAGYRMGAQEKLPTDIARQNLKIKERQSPGVIAAALSLIKENLNWILGVLATLIGIWATYVTIRKDQIETKLKELELNPGGAGQTS